MPRSKAEPASTSLVMTSWAALAIATLFIVLQLRGDILLLPAHWNHMPPWSTVGVAALAYLLSHAFRFVRFALLVGASRLRPLLGIYLLSTGASYAIPFKLGELFRIYWIGVHTSNLQRGLIVVWIERVLDAAIILLLYFIASAIRPDSLPSSTSSALIVIPFMIVLSVLMLKVLPENLDNLNLWILQSYRGKAATRRLRWLSKMALFAREAMRILANRTLSLVMLTLCIWGLEIYAIHLALHANPQASSTVSAFFGKMTAILSKDGNETSVASLAAFGVLQGIGIGVLAITACIAAVHGLLALRRTSSS